MADVESYEPLIRQILTAPGVDLSTISAKRVRKQLVEMDDSLTTEFVRENKDEFDRVIGGVYEEVSAAREDNGAKGKRTSRDEGDDYGSGGDGEEQEEQEGELKPAKAKRAKKGSSTDEDLARQLDSEINGRQRAARASSTSTRGRGGKRRGRGGARSSNADELDEDGEPKKKRRGGGFQKEYMIRYVSCPCCCWIRVDISILASLSWPLLRWTNSRARRLLRSSGNTSDAITSRTPATRRRSSVTTNLKPCLTLTRLICLR